MATSKISVGIRLSAEARDEGMRRSQEEMRSFGGYIEWLIMQDAKANPAKSADPKPAKPKRKAAPK